ncbi:MAG: hypothetical protein JO074_02860 [Frankiales bacterium]|nr:hypothetical protein [Frankiales bacterium]
MSAATVQPARGALVTVGATGVRESLTFQFNPESVRRTYQPNVVGGGTGARSVAVRFAAAATESITLQCFLSSLQPSGAAPYGVAPQLAALTTMLNPPTSQVAQAEQALATGTIEVAPPLAPLLLFVWGGRPAVPVQLTGVDVTEQLFDTDLWPVRATADLSMRALTYSDVAAASPAFAQSLVNQREIERLAAAAFTPGGGW